MCALLDIADPGSFVCSLRFALSILCFVLTMNLYAQRMGMSVAIVCMVNHTAVVMMRDTDRPIISSSSRSNATTVTPGEWQKNETDNVNELLESPCGNTVVGSNRSVAMVTILVITRF